MLFMRCNSVKSCNSNKILAVKERKEHKEKNLCCFFFAIFVFFCGQFFFGCGSVALGLLRLFAANPRSPNGVESCKFYDFRAFQPFRGKSIEAPLHEPFTRQTEFSWSSPVKANQA
jgi:hypothetical protein